MIREAQITAASVELYGSEAAAGSFTWTHVKRILEAAEKAAWQPIFSPDEVLALDRHQRGEGAVRLHPFTCPNRSDGNHRENSVDLGALVPTVHGWVCPYCDYTQDWAHGFMKRPLPHPPTESA